MLHAALDNQIHLGPLPNHSLDHRTKITVDDVNFWYGAKQALRHVSLDISANEVTAFLGPSGCGKTTLLRCLNRTNEIIDGVCMQGRILLDGLDIYAPDLDPTMLRRRFGWIAQRPNPFPWSIRTNIVYGPRIQGLVAGREDREALVERSLRDVGLWDEVKDRLNDAGPIFRSGSSSGCVSRGPSQPGQRSFSWSNRARRSIR